MGWLEFENTLERLHGFGRVAGAHGGEAEVGRRALAIEPLDHVRVRREVRPRHDRLAALGLGAEAFEPADGVAARDGFAGERARVRSVMPRQPIMRPPAEAALLWIPITIAAAAFQTARNAFQRGLTGELSALGATYTRFLFGFPFAALYALAVFGGTDTPAPATTPAFFAWAALGGVSQILGTAFLLQLFQLRNFSTGIAFSKSEVLQVAVFGLLVLGDAITLLAALAIAVATAGLVLLARETGALDWRSALAGLGGKPALLGLGTGAAFAIAAVGFRGASLSLGLSFVASAAATLATSTLIQSVLMTLYLRWREPGQIGAVLRAWRRSLLPGFTGAAASACWFTAMTLEVAAYVRMLGLIEVLFGYAVAIFALRERPGRREQVGTALLVAAIVGLLWDRAAA